MSLFYISGDSVTTVNELSYTHHIELQTFSYLPWLKLHLQP